MTTFIVALRRAPAFHGVGDDMANALLHRGVEKRIVQIVRTLRCRIVHQRLRSRGLPCFGRGPASQFRNQVSRGPNIALSQGPKVYWCIQGVNRYPGGYVPAKIPQ